VNQKLRRVLLEKPVCQLLRFNCAIGLVRVSWLGCCLHRSASSALSHWDVLWHAVIRVTVNFFATVFALAWPLVCYCVVRQAGNNSGQ
tara:strand:- start:4902 stop:5165 length:264 start_codon:yes stop_codon:yes gene_type:complete